MWVRLTSVKIDPSDLEAASTLYYSDEISGVVRRQPGYTASTTSLSPRSIRAR